MSERKIMSLKTVHTIIEFLMPILVVTTATLFLFYGERTSNSEITYNKKDIESKISGLVKNNANLESIKHSYSSDLIISPKKTRIFKPNTDNNSSTRKYKPTLREILLDIKNDLILNSPNDTAIIKLQNIIDENDRNNPFAKLEENQKYFFVNIMSKLDSNYSFVEDDLLRISDELDNKNKLVTEYLSNAKGAYRNSTIAMTIAFISLMLVIILNLKRIFSIFKKSRL